MRFSARIAIAALTACLLLAGAGCGGGGKDESDSGQQTLPAKASTANFPRPSHRSLRELIGRMQQGPALAPSVHLLNTGRNRFGFGLFDRAKKQIGGLEMVLYVSRGTDETAHGPYGARFEPIEVKPAYQSKTSAQDPDAAKGIYVADLPFAGPGNHLVIGVTRVGGQLVATSPAQVRVTAHGRVPRPGDRAISVHTPTKGDVGGNLEKIDTRVPPDSMHDVDLADALAQHRPVLLLFSTPALCQSRVCGPVTDVAEQVHHDLGDKVAFIHMEVYRDNDPNKGVNPQMAAWHLRAEPFAFAINSKGRVVERLEGAFTVAELQAALHKALA